MNYNGPYLVSLHLCKYTPSPANKRQLGPKLALNPKIVHSKPKARNSQPNALSPKT